MYFHMGMFAGNRFLSNFMYDKNMMLWNEKPNKMGPYRGQLFLWDTKDFTYLTFFTIFIDYFVGMKS